mgnify:CR=1 FL=1
MVNNRYKILLVEDEANIRTIIATLLETSDYQVIQADTCIMAKTMFSSYQPDVIVLDLGFRIWMECIFWNLFGRNSSL